MTFFSMSSKEMVTLFSDEKSCFKEKKLLKFMCSVNVNQILNAQLKDQSTTRSQSDSNS